MPLNQPTDQRRPSLITKFQLQIEYFSKHQQHAFNKTPDYGYLSLPLATRAHLKIDRKSEVVVVQRRRIR